VGGRKWAMRRQLSRKIANPLGARHSRNSREGTHNECDIKERAVKYMNKSEMANASPSATEA